MIRPWIGVAFLASVCVGGGAANAADEALISAAVEEGVVVWYATTNAEGYRALSQGFETKYPGIRVEVVPGTNADLMVKLQNEYAADKLQADLVMNETILVNMMREGNVAPYVAESAADYPPELKSPDGYWTAAYMLYGGPSYNTNLVSEDEAPKTWDDLLDPKWKGKIAWTTNLTTGGAAGFIGAVLTNLGEEEGMEYLQKLATQELVNYPGNQRVVLDQVIVGEFPLALATYNHHVALSSSQGAPVKWIPMKPAVTGSFTPVFLLRGALHPNAAKLFIDYVLSKEGQETLAAAGGGYLPAHPGVEAADPTLLPAGGGFEAVIFDPLYAADHLDQWIGVYNELFK